MEDEIKVSELPEATQVNDNDVMMIIQNGVNKKVTRRNLEMSEDKKVKKIEKILTEGSTDTYRVTYTDNSTENYQFINGEVTQVEFDEVKTEMINARTSSLKDTTFNNLNERLDDIESDIDEIENTSITALQAENAYLNSVIEQAFDEISGQGENVTLENTINARFKKGPLPGGNTTQATRSGKNILATPSGTKQFNNQYYYSDDLGITITQDMVNKAISFSFKITISSISTEATTVYAGLGYGDSGYTAELKSTNYSDYSVGDHIIKIENAIITSEMVGKKIFARHLGFNQASTATYTWTNAQFEFSATATDYEPYGVMPSPEFPSTIQNVTGNINTTVCGENLVNYNGDTVQLIKNTNRNINITPDNFPITLEAGTYTIGFPDFTNENQSQNLGVQLVDINGNPITMNFINSSKKGTKIITETKIIEKLYLYILTNDNDNATVTFSKIMLSKEDSQGEYVPYQGQLYTLSLGSIELCKIGNYQDYSYKNNNDNKWYKHETIKKITDTSGSTGITINDMISDGTILSYYGGTVSGKTITYDSAISGTNTIYYPLATPNDIEITDTTLISQLEAIEKATSYKGTTHIYSTNELSPIFDVVALGRAE